MIEVAEQISPVTAERAYRRSIELKKGWDQNKHVAEAGMRAAKARDPRLLMVLEKCAEVLYRMNEEQFGQTQRDTSRDLAERVMPVEVQVWREAYKTADAGTPLVQYAWVYGAAGELAGVIY